MRANRRFLCWRRFRKCIFFLRCRRQFSRPRRRRSAASFQKKPQGFFERGGTARKKATLFLVLCARARKLPPTAKKKTAKRRNLRFPKPAVFKRLPLPKTAIPRNPFYIYISPSPKATANHFLRITRTGNIKNICTPMIKRRKNQWKTAIYPNASF